jgi:hypothetical protein
MTNHHCRGGSNQENIARIIILVATMTKYPKSNRLTRIGRNYHLNNKIRMAYDYNNGYNSNNIFLNGYILNNYLFSGYFTNDYIPVM